MFPRIGPARPDDLEAVLGLLRESHLPPDGLSEHVATILVARHEGRIVGSAALELYGDVPAGVRQSVQFASACPSTATVMRQRLGGGL